MYDFNTKEVRFDIWCPTCLYLEVDDTKGKEPCNSCMAVSGRKNTTKPIKHKAKSGNRHRKV